MESLTRPLFHHRRKLSSVSSSGNGLSFSGKDAYDDVLCGGGAPPKAKYARTVVVEDYGEIFAGGGKPGGRVSSIPVLDLSDLDRTNGTGEFRSSKNKLDYSKIFGGFAGDDEDDGLALSVPPYEEIFGTAAKKVKCHKAKDRRSADIGSPLKASDRFNSAENNRGFSSEASDQNLDGGKQLNMSYHKTGQRSKDGSNGTTHIAQLHAVPGFAYFIDEATRLQKKEHDKLIPPVETEVNHNKSSSGDRTEGKSGRRAKWQLPNTQASEGLVNGKDDSRLDQSYSNGKLFYSGELDLKSRPSKVPPTSSPSASGLQSHSKGKLFYSGELGLKSSPSKVPPPSSSSVDQSHSNGKKSYSGELDHKLRPSKVPPPSSSSVNKSCSGAKSFDSGEVEPRMHPSKVHPTSSSSVDQSLLNGKFSYSGELDFNSHPSKVPPPSSSSANFFSDREHPKQSKYSECGPKSEALRQDVDDYLTPSDEELDVNSAAAVSAAALKKALQQAQESIRIAKELMERKKGPVQSSKSHSTNTLKVKDRRKVKYDQDISCVREKNMREACESLDTEAQTFTEFDQKIDVRNGEVASAFRDTEKPSTDAKAGAENHKENAEVAEEPGVAMWFTQLLNNGKNRMAALASQLVDNKNNILHSVSKHTDNIEETKPVKEALERGTVEKMDNADRVLGRPGYVEAKLDACSRTAELENVDKFDLAHFVPEGNVSAQKGQATKEIRHDFDEMEKCEKKLEEHQETIDDRRFDSENLEKGCPANEFADLLERKMEEHKLFELEMEENLDGDHMCEGNENKKDDEEIGRKQEESCLCEGNEDKTNAATVNAVGGKEHEDGLGNMLAGYNEQEFEEQSLTHSFDGTQNQNMPEEEHICEGIEHRPTQANQNEATDADADNSIESEKIEMNLGTQQAEEAQGELDASEENLRAGIFSEPAYENLNASFAACDNDESTTLGNPREPCASEVKINSDLTSQLGVQNYDENSIPEEVIEQASQLVDRSTEEIETETEQAVVGAFRLMENNISESSYLDRSVAREDVLGSVIRDLSESLGSDDSNVGFSTTTHEQKLSTDTGLPKETALIHSGNEEVAFASDDVTEASLADESPSNCAFMDMNEQNKVKEIDEDSEVAIGPENKDGLVHESGGNAENVMGDGISSKEEVEKDNIELDHKERDWIEKQQEPEYSQLPNECKRSEEHLETDKEMKAGQSIESNEENMNKTSQKEEKEPREAGEKDNLEKIEVNKREREREKDRIAVERAIREARERAFAEARERAERAAVERATAEVRQRAMAGAREKLEKVSAGTKVSTDKASIEAKLRAERAAVDRATAEARERALEKAMSQKTISETRVQTEKVVTGKSSGTSRDSGLKHSLSSSDLERFDGINNESAQRRKARLERHQRIMERAAKALAEKNMRDILAQREQAERNRLAETLDADIRRWVSGKEGNLRALLSTLQYILGPDSGWQPVSLTEIITTNAVKKIYRKATLYVHPDKLQQRGASIQQKYICEKVFDLLKAAWNKFYSEER